MLWSHVIKYIVTCQINQYLWSLAKWLFLFLCNSIPVSKTHYAIGASAPEWNCILNCGWPISNPTTTYMQHTCTLTYPIIYCHQPTRPTLGLNIILYSYHCSCLMLCGSTVHDTTRRLHNRYCLLHHFTPIIQLKAVIAIVIPKWSFDPLACDSIRVASIILVSGMGMGDQLEQLQCQLHTKVLWLHIDERQNAQSKQMMRFFFSSVEYHCGEEW